MQYYNTHTHINKLSLQFLNSYNITYIGIGMNLIRHTPLLCTYYNRQNLKKKQYESRVENEFGCTFCVSFSLFWLYIFVIQTPISVIIKWYIKFSGLYWTEILFDLLACCRKCTRVLKNIKFLLLQKNKKKIVKGSRRFKNWIFPHLTPIMYSLNVNWERFFYSA